MAHFAEIIGIALFVKGRTAMKRPVLSAICALALCLVAGCNTIAGFGRDLQAGGRAISEASDEVAGKARSSSTASNETCDPVPRDLKGRSALPPCKR